MQTFLESKPRTESVNDQELIKLSWKLLDYENPLKSEPIRGNTGNKDLFGCSRN